MLGVLSVILPVFLVIGAGYLATATKRFPDAAIDAVTTFVTRIAVPALLFGKMYALELAQSFSAPMLLAFYAGALANFAIAGVAARALGRRPGESVAIGFCAVFSNSVLLGLPVILRAYGEAALTPVYAIVALHAPVLFLVGMIAMEMAHAEGRGAIEAVRRASANIVRNALMIAIALGIGLNLLDARLPAPLIEAVDLLSAAALPTALFALGAALTRYRIQAELPWAFGVAALQLALHPLVAWLLTDQAFGLETPYVRAAVMTAAMPAGINIYIFAVMYRRAEGIAASSVLVSTLISVFTISAWLAFLGGAG